MTTAKQQKKDNAMTIEKRVAEAILKAQDMREKSWDKRRSKYKLEEEECFEKACAELSLPDQLWFVLHLANHWSNDLRDWAEAIVAGKRPCDDAPEGVDTATMREIVDGKKTFDEMMRKVNP